MNRFSLSAADLIHGLIFPPWQMRRTGNVVRIVGRQLMVRRVSSKAFPVLADDIVSPSSEDFKANKAEMDKLVEELNKRVAEVKEGKKEAE